MSWMYLITQFCLIVTIIETSISWNYNLLKIYLLTKLHVKGLRMRDFKWNCFPIENLLIDSLLTPIVESTYTRAYIRLPVKGGALLSASWLLNIERLTILKLQRKKTSITGEHDSEVYDEFTASQTKPKIKTTTEDINSLKYCYVRLFDVFVLHSLLWVTF